MTEHVDIEVVALASSEFEASTLAAVLEDAGIEARVVPPPAAHGLRVDKQVAVPIQVRREDLDRARAVLEERRASAAELDWEQVEVGEPPEHVDEGPHRMPVAAWAGFIVAAAIVVLGLIAALVLLVT